MPVKCKRTVWNGERVYMYYYPREASFKDKVKRLLYSKAIYYLMKCEKYCMKKRPESTYVLSVPHFANVDISFSR